MANKPKALSDLTKKTSKVKEGSNLNFSLNIQHRDDLTEVQKKIIEAALDKEVKCVIIDGVPGTGKSWTTILSSLMLLDLHIVKEIVYLRSLVQAKDGQTGYLKGDLDEKTFYYNEALNQTLSELIPNNDIKIHKNKISTIGGLTIFLSMILFYLIDYCFTNLILIFDNSKLLTPFFLKRVNNVVFTIDCQSFDCFKINHSIFFALHIKYRLQTFQCRVISQFTTFKVFCHL